MKRHVSARRARPAPLTVMVLALHTALAAQCVTVDGGVFTPGGPGGDRDELGAGAVRISPFCIDKYEVTFAQYDTCVKRGACTPAHYDDGGCLVWTAGGFTVAYVPAQFRDPSYPVVCVTWRQAKDYCRFKGGNLPTEAQWELAAGGGSSRTYAWGDDPPTAARCTQPSEHKPRRVGSFPPGARGLHDMTGNVWEWTDDRYCRDFYAFADSVDPRAPGVGRYCTIRGGGWYSEGAQLRVRNRHWFQPERGEVSIGFRCVK